MTQDELEQQLRAIIVEQLDIDAEHISRDTALYDELGMDSIDAVDILQRITELTGVRLSPEQFRSIQTVGDFTDALASLSAE